MFPDRKGARKENPQDPQRIGEKNKKKSQRTKEKKETSTHNKRDNF